MARLAVVSAALLVAVLQAATQPAQAARPHGFPDPSHVELLSAVPAVVNGARGGDPGDTGPMDTSPHSAGARPGAKDCTTHWFTQDLDHFSWSSPAPGAVTTFQQRFLVFDKFWTSSSSSGPTEPAEFPAPESAAASASAAAPRGPIFFYVGNEGDVELYAVGPGQIVLATS
jgi:hypothetical protein